MCVVKKKNPSTCKVKALPEGHPWHSLCSKKYRKTYQLLEFAGDSFGVLKKRKLPIGYVELCYKNTLKGHATHVFAMLSMDYNHLKESKSKEFQTAEYYFLDIP